MQELGRFVPIQILEQAIKVLKGCQIHEVLEPYCILLKCGRMEKYIN